MISNNKKRLEITLATEDLELLNSLSLRFHISKSEAIRQALKIFAAKRKHVYKVMIQESNDSKTIAKPQQNDEYEDYTWEQLVEELPPVETK